MKNNEFVRMMFWCILLGFSVANAFLWFVASKTYAGGDYTMLWAVLVFEALIILFAYLNERYNFKKEAKDEK